MILTEVASTAPRVRRRRRSFVPSKQWLPSLVIIRFMFIFRFNFCMTAAFVAKSNTLGTRMRSHTSPKFIEHRISKSWLFSQASITEKEEEELSNRMNPMDFEDSSLSQSRCGDLDHVWIWNEDTVGKDFDSNREQWRRPTKVNSHTAEEVTTLVRNWCEGFVLALDLCPWAKASLQTSGAMRFFLVPPSAEASSVDPNEISFPQLQELENRERIRMDTIVDSVTQRFQADILDPASRIKDEFDFAKAGESQETIDSMNPGSIASHASMLERAAIYFVVFLPHDNGRESAYPLSLSDSFVDFIDWFTDLEENWPEESDNVIVAPFHPQWEFGSDNDESMYDPEAYLDYEKRSPFPLVTLVSTSVVEKAGVAVTEAIGEHNKQILLEIEEEQQELRNRTGATTESTKSHRDKSVADLWWSAVYGGTKPE